MELGVRVRHRLKQLPCVMQEQWQPQLFREMRQLAHKPGRQSVPILKQDLLL